MESKQCYECREVKPVTEYRKNSFNKGGLQGTCKSCMKKKAETRTLKYESVGVLTHRTCSSCSEDKPASEFRKSKSNKGGLSYVCRACMIKAHIPTYGPKTSERIRLFLEEQRKVCSSCGETLDLSSFGNSSNSPDGLSYACKGCLSKKSLSRREPVREKINEKLRSLRKDMGEEQKEVLRQRCRDYYKKSRERILKERAQQRIDNPDAVRAAERERMRKKKETLTEDQKILIREKVKKSREARIAKLLAEGKPLPKYVPKNRKEWYWKNRSDILEKRRPYYADRWRNDVLYRLRVNIRSRLNTAVKREFRSGSAVSDLGCSIPEFKQYIESLWKPGMSWDNWTTNGWHMDHIVPLTAFELMDREQFLSAVHYTNIRPLWYDENIRKGGVKKKVRVASEKQEQPQDTSSGEGS